MKKIFKKPDFFEDKDICEEVTMMKRILNKVMFYFSKDEKGATAVEYALIVALIALAIVVGVTAVGGGLNTAFTNISTQIGAAFGG